MNDLNELAPDDRAFATAARARLRSSERLDAPASARLAAARARAVAALTPRWSLTTLSLWLLPPAAAAMALMLSLLLPSATGPTPPAPGLNAAAVNGPDAAALEWATDGNDPAFYRDLEFYQWQESRGAKPHA